MAPAPAATRSTAKAPPGISRLSKPVRLREDHPPWRCILWRRGGSASRPSLRAQPASPQTGLRFGIAPERLEVFDPVDLASPDFAERMMEIGHRRDVRLGCPS